MWTHALPQCTYVGRGTAHKSPFSSHHVPGSQESNSGYQTWCQVPAEPLQKPSSYDYYYYSFSNIHAKFSISSHYSTILNHKGKSPKRAIKLSSSLTLCLSALFLLKETICSAVFSSSSHCWLLYPPMIPPLSSGFTPPLPIMATVRLFIHLTHRWPHLHLQLRQKTSTFMTQPFRA